jgi:hypothetical protein
VESSSKFSLWNSKLFPVLSTREESAKHAVDMIHRLKQLETPPPPPCKHVIVLTVFYNRLYYSLLAVSLADSLVCVDDMLLLKSTDTVLEYHNELRKQIIH